MKIPVTAFLSNFLLPADIQKQYHFIKQFRGAFNECIKPMTTDAELANLYQKHYEGKPPANPYPIMLFQSAGIYPSRYLRLMAINIQAQHVFQKLCGSGQSFTLNNVRLEKGQIISEIAFQVHYSISWAPYTAPAPHTYTLTDWLAIELDTPEWTKWENNINNPEAIALLLQTKLNLQLQQELSRYLTKKSIPEATLFSWGIRYEQPFYYEKEGKKRTFICLDIQFEIPYYLTDGIALGHHKTFGFGIITPH